MVCVEKWEKLQEGEMDFDNENLEEWFTKDRRVEGFLEAGNVLEDLLIYVIVFVNLKDMLEKSAGTVQTHNREHQTILTSDKSQHNLEKEQPCQENKI